MLWRHRYEHIMYASALSCRPGAVQKIPQFRTFRREVPFATISSVYDDPRLWGHVLRWGSALSYSDLAGCASHNLNLYVPQFRCRIILTRSKIAGDTIIDYQRSNRVCFDSGAWRMLPGDAPTYRDRPEPTKWSKTVVGTAQAKQAEC